MAGEGQPSAGEDFSVGDVVLSPGQLITPAHIMALAAVGGNELSVTKPPKIAVFCTGDELFTDVSKTLKSGMIYNSNGPYL